MGQPEFARRRRLNFKIQARRYVHAATPLWLKPMYIIRPTSTCFSTPYARRLKNAPGFHGVASWRAGDNIGTTSGSSKSSIVSSKSSGPPLRKLSKSSVPVKKRGARNISNTSSWPMGINCESGQAWNFWKNGCAPP